MHIFLSKTTRGFCLGATRTPAQISLTLYYALRDTLTCIHSDITLMHALRQHTLRLREVSQLTFISEVKQLMLGKRTPQNPSYAGLKSPTKQPLWCRRQCRRCFRPLLEQSRGQDNPSRAPQPRSIIQTTGVLDFGWEQGTHSPLVQRGLSNQSCLKKSQRETSASKATCCFPGGKDDCRSVGPQCCTQIPSTSQDLVRGSYSCTFGCTNFSSSHHQKESACD